MLLRPEHGSAERVLAEGGPVDQVLGDDGRLVVRARDLLDNDATLAVEFLRVDARSADEVGQQVDRLGTTSARQVMWKATRSCDVYAFSTAPSRSAVSLTLR